jgi:hypothetical protein
MRLYNAISPLFFITLPGFSPSSLMPDSRAHGSVMSVHWAGILLAEYGKTSSSGWPGQNMGDVRASHSHSAGRLLVLSLLATLVSIVMWLLGYHAENKGLHLRYQANSLKSRRVISYLTLAENILRHSPLVLKRTALSAVLNHLARTYQSMVLVY